MLKNISIRTKLFLTVLALAVPALILVGVLSYLGGKTAVERTTHEHLTSVRAGKANQIEGVLRSDSKSGEDLCKKRDDYRRDDGLRRGASGDG